MTEPGSVAAPSPGWWVRTNRVGTTNTIYGWWASIIGEVNLVGIASSVYGWVSAGAGHRTGTFDEGAAAYVATTEGTTAGAWTDLTTTTDSVTIDVSSSGIVLVTIYAYIVNAGSVGYALSGTNNRSPDDSRSIYHYASGDKRVGAAFLETGLNPGSTTFKMKYLSTSCNYADRRITVNPLWA